MEALQLEIQTKAEAQYQKLCRVAPELDSLLFPSAKKGCCIPFGSFVNGTYTGQSDIDVYILNNSKDYCARRSRILNLVQHLQKKYGIPSTTTGKIMFLSWQGIKINVVAANKSQITQTQVRDEHISKLVSHFPLYCDVVRYLKLFAETYVERFQDGRENKLVYPGSHFYTVAAVVALGLSCEQPAIQGSPTYPEAIKIVAKFIGNDEYMGRKTDLQKFDFDPLAKFKDASSRMDFNRCFLALVAHLEQNIPLPQTDLHTINVHKPTASLLAILNIPSGNTVKRATEKKQNKPQKPKQRRSKRCHKEKQESSVNEKEKFSDDIADLYETNEYEFLCEYYDDYEHRSNISFNLSHRHYDARYSLYDARYSLYDARYSLDDILYEKDYYYY